MRFCPKCGHSNPPNLGTCVGCGVIFAKIRTSEHRPPAAGPRPPGSDSVPAPDSGSNSGSAARLPTLDRATLIRVGGLAAVVALAGWLIHSWSAAPLEVVGQPVGNGGPVLVLMHGYGAPVRDLVPFARRLTESLPELTVVLPGAQHWAGGGRAWIKGPSLENATETRAESLEQLLGVIDDLHDDGVTADNLYIGGFSQGAIMTLELLLNQPKPPRVHGIALLSGRLPRGMSSHGDYLSAVGALRVFISHGRKDRAVGFNHGQGLVQMFETAGFEVDFVDFPGPHTIPLETEDRLLAFLSAH